MSEIQNKINQLIENRETARLGGGQKRIDAQHAKGKYTASSRRFRPSSAPAPAVPFIRPP